MFVPKRKGIKDREIPKRELLKEDEFVNEVVEMTAKEKQEILAEIESKFKTALEEISLTQLLRFYSLVESRNFYADSKEIKEFIDEQITRANATGDSELTAAKPFYETFEQEILENKKYTREEFKKRMETLKRFSRYIIGQKRIKGGK